ncbi:uncharacterized protein LOC114804139 [Zeugodacus cucurbitae]|uniref:Uncharacterized protein n=1 Tax=Zeugodacus cucurbitae TaxID=28588 RepID=A0A0A1WVJ8_ZEUCU|nr:uncharacterized protein LOC114804139 [Zeugodacus cucurbitae]
MASLHFVIPSHTSIKEKVSDEGQKQIVLRSSLKRKSGSSISSGILYAGSDSSESSQQRRAHFDQRNIDMTYKPVLKDYGYIQIKQSATPFPRRSSGTRLSLTDNRKSSRQYHEEMKNLIDPILPRDFSTLSLKPGEVPMDFVTKRKIFCKGEFTITRQRKSMQVHPPLTNLDETGSIRSSPSNLNLTQFFRKHYQQRDGPIYFD